MLNFEGTNFESHPPLQSPAHTTISVSPLQFVDDDGTYDAVDQSISAGGDAFDELLNLDVGLSRSPLLGKL